MNDFYPTYNRHISNKLLWMSRQLRHLNDPISISGWANGMALLKSLLMTSPQNHFRNSPKSSLLPAPSYTLSKGKDISCAFAPYPGSNLAPMSPDIIADPVKTFVSAVSKPANQGTRHWNGIKEDVRPSVDPHIAIKLTKGPTAELPKVPQLPSIALPRPHHQCPNVRTKNFGNATTATQQLSQEESTIISWLGDKYQKRSMEVLFDDLHLNIYDAREIFKALYEKVYNRTDIPMRNRVLKRLSKLTA